MATHSTGIKGRSNQGTWGTHSPPEPWAPGLAELSRRRVGREGQMWQTSMCLSSLLGAPFTLLFHPGIRVTGLTNQKILGPPGNEVSEHTKVSQWLGQHLPKLPTPPRHS